MNLRARARGARLAEAARVEVAARVEAGVTRAVPAWSQRFDPAPAAEQGRAGSRRLDQEVASPLGDATAALRQGQWERARAGFEAVLEEGESPEAQDGLAEAAWWLEDPTAVLAARQRAYHLFRQRGDDRRAGGVATELGFDHAVFRLELAVANGWFQRAHRLLDELGPVGERVWLGLREAELAYHTAGDMAYTRELAAGARKLAADLGLLDAEMMGQALEGLALVGLGEVDGGLRRLDEATVAAVSGELESYKAIAGICCFIIFACERVRDIERASQWCEHYMAYCQRNGMPGYLAFCRAHHASVLAARGRWADAEGELERAREELSARPAWSMTVFSRLGELRRRQGRLDEAAALFERAQPHPGGVLGAARLALDRGEVETARDLAEGLLDRVPERDRVERLAAVELVADLRCAAGAVVAGEAAVAELEAVAEAADTDWLQATASHLRGRLALAGADPAAATAPLQLALDAYNRVGLPFEAALAHTDLARALRGVDRHDAAQEKARSASAIFDELGAAVEAGKAEALVDEWSAAGHGPGGGVLSSREAQVLRLVAHGASNQDIADELVVSLHTVRRHVSNLLAKLGVSSRTAAAAWAHEHDLA